MSGQQYKNTAAKKDTYIKAGATALGTFLATGIGALSLAKIRERYGGKPWTPEDTQKFRKKAHAFALAGGAVGGITSLVNHLLVKLKILQKILKRLRKVYGTN